MTDASSRVWDAALAVAQRLREHGHRTLFAGGCVRDRILRASPKDVDVVTDAVPTEVARLFRGARMVGAQFGVVLVRRMGIDVEVATFRSDGAYTDGRHPDSVQFGSERDDAARRDFTINGLFLDPVTDEVIDYVDGRADIEAGVVRAIGDPYRRFAEDHLRMLRAVRFATSLSFRIDAETAAAITALAPRLGGISPERIWGELQRILVHPGRAAGWELLRALGLRPHLSPEWPLDEARDQRAYRRFGSSAPSPISPALGLAAALHPMPDRSIERLGRALHLDNRLIHDVRWLVSRLEAVQAAASMEPADIKELMWHAHWEDLLLLWGWDCAAEGASLAERAQLIARANAIPPEQVRPAPFIDGHVLARLGATDGPLVGHVLRAVYRAQLNGAIHSAGDAIEMAKNKIVEGLGDAKRSIDPP